jgi:hypothetical protein
MRSARCRASCRRPRSPTARAPWRRRPCRAAAAAARPRAARRPRARRQRMHERRGVAALEVGDDAAERGVGRAPFAQHQRAEAGALAHQVDQVLAHHEGQLGAQAVELRQLALQFAGNLVVPAANDFQAQLALAAEVGEHGGLGDAQALRDLQRGGALEALFGEDFLGYASRLSMRRPDFSPRAVRRVPVVSVSDMSGRFLRLAQ